MLRWPWKLSVFQNSNSLINSYQKIPLYSIKQHHSFLLFPLNAYWLHVQLLSPVMPLHVFSYITRFNFFTHIKHSPYFSLWLASSISQALSASLSIGFISFIHSMLYKVYVIDMIHINNPYFNFFTFPTLICKYTFVFLRKTGNFFLVKLTMNYLLRSHYYS